MMKLILLYLVVILIAILYLSLLMVNKTEPAELHNIRTLVFCILAAGFGGLIYCFRGVYLNACVRKTWSADWYPWYFIRPIVSLLMGGVCYIFLNAGLLVLESQKKPDSSHVAFYAVAFIAGLNVDKFIAKLEDIAKTAWGIDKSRASNDTNPQNKAIEENHAKTTNPIDKGVDPKQGIIS